MISHNLTWRRCPSCGQLTLVPVNADACWHCGGPIAPRSSADAAAPAPLPEPHTGSGPTFPRVHGFDLGAATDRNLPAPGPRPMGLTPADDAVARRLLASVFPDGVDP